MDKFFERFGGGSYDKQPAAVGTEQVQGPSAPSEPLPRSRAMAQDKVPQEQGQPAQGASPDAFQQRFGAGASGVSQEGPTPPEVLQGSVMSDGSEPVAAIPDSPLSIFDRARLGWVRTPAAQRKILSDHFGDKNVEMVTHNDKEAGFVVRDKDGKWYQVDPHLSWKNLGPLSVPEMDTANLKRFIKDAPGDLTQFTGEYGLRTAGAIMANVVGSPLTAASGPFAPATAIGLAGAGSAAGEALNMGLMHLTNPELDPKSSEEIQKQLQAAFMFGMTQEAGGQAFKIGGKAVIGGLAKLLKAVSDTPTGRYLASKSLSMISGQPESLMRVRVDDPMGVAKYDSIAMDDAVNATNKLGDAMKEKVQGLYDDFQKRKALVFGKQYDAIEEAAGKMDFDPMKPHGAVDGGQVTDPTSQLMQEITNAGYVKNGKPVAYQASKDVERMLTNNEQKTLAYVLAQSRNISEKTLQNKPVSFQEMKNLVGTMDRVLYEQDGIADPNLRRILSDYRRNLKNNIIDTIAEKDPELAKRYVELDQKYAPAKNLLETLATKTEDQKVDAFMKEITKQDGTFNSDLIGNLSDLLGQKDPTSEILKMHVAKNSTDFLQGRRFLKIVPGSPYLASRAVTATSAAKAPFKPMTAATVAYTDKAWQFLKTLPAGQRAAMMADPEAMKVIGQITTNASMAEQQDSDKMLKEAGVTQ